MNLPLDFFTCNLIKFSYNNIIISYIQMKKFILERGEWKTTNLVILSSKTWVPILTPYDNIKYIESLAKWLNLKIPKPITFWDNLKWNIELIVDDADYILEKMLWCKIIWLSMTDVPNN